MWWLRQTRKQCIKQLILMGLSENHTAHHHSNQQRMKNKKREREANSFGCMFYSVAVLGLWDHFSIGFVMWLGFVFKSCVSLFALWIFMMRLRYELWLWYETSIFAPPRMWNGVRVESSEANQFCDMLPCTDWHTTQLQNISDVCLSFAYAEQQKWFL